jgi:cyclase
MIKNNLKVRVIPVILLHEGIVVRSRNFNFYQVVGNPFAQVERYNSWNVDELIYLDISRTGKIDIDETSKVIGSTSAKKRYINGQPKDIYEFVEFLSTKCFMPLTYGGGIKDIDQIHKLLNSGADKVAINTNAFNNRNLIVEAATQFGSQCIVVSIDCKKTDIGNEVFIEGGSTPTGVKAEDWAKEAERLGAGELLINSIDRDGTGAGFDASLYLPIIDNVSIPVIICGGVGVLQHFSKGYFEIHPHALAAANIFHFIEHSDYQIKKHLSHNNVNVRF